MLYRISVAERGLTGIANIFRSRLSRLYDLLRAGTVPLSNFSFEPPPHNRFEKVTYVPDLIGIHEWALDKGRRWTVDTGH